MFNYRLCSKRISTLPIKKISTVFLTLLFISLACARTSEAAQDTAMEHIALANSETNTPLIEVPETLFDFGEIKDGDDYVHAFTIWNLGTGVLEIKKVLPG
jgi:hypothetical protein